MATQTISSLTILEEVDLIQSELRSRLEGALSSPPPSVSPSSLPSVPLIDLSPSFSSSLAARRQVAQEIRSACLSTGFFQISNHGITPEAQTGILTQAERFFKTLSTSQKEALHIRHSTLFRGYEAGGETYANPDDHKKTTSGPTDDTNTGSEAETKEGFNWGYEPSLDPTGGDGQYVELDGEPADPSCGRGNVWPSEDDLPGFLDGVRTYYAQALSLSRHLFQLFALSLDLDESHFDALVTHPGGIGRLLYYPPQPSSALHKKTGKLGLGAHTDYECFTLLLCSTHPGLEILFPPSAATENKPIWRPCPIRPGTLTVNVADFLQRWTNGLYKSTIHRVVSREAAPGAGSSERFSVPFFFSINYDAEVEKLPENKVGPSRFQNMKAGEYVLERLRATV